MNPPDNKTWIIHRSGWIDLADPSWNIQWEDIAHSLGRLCRWTGWVRDHYSVAQHSVIGSEVFTSKRLQLLFLVHDVHETVTGDLNRAVRNILGQKYLDLAERIQSSFYSWSEIDPPTEEEKAEIDQVDNRSLVDEYQSQWDTPPVDIVENTGLEPLVLDCHQGWPAEQASAMWLARVQSLTSAGSSYFELGRSQERGNLDQKPSFSMMRGQK